MPSIMPVEALTLAVEVNDELFDMSTHTGDLARKDDAMALAQRVRAVASKLERIAEILPA